MMLLKCDFPTSKLIDLSNVNLVKVFSPQTQQPACHRVRVGTKTDCTQCETMKIYTKKVIIKYLRNYTDNFNGTRFPNE